MGIFVIIFISPKIREFDINGKNATSHPASQKNIIPAQSTRPRGEQGRGTWRVGFNVWLNRFIKVINGWHLIKKNARVIVVTMIITFVQVLISSLMLWLQFRVFGIEVSFVSALFLSAIGSLSLVIGLTPGNLGVQEAIIVFSAATIGITPAESLSAALLGRAVSLVVLFVLGPIFSYVLVRNGKEKGKKGKGKDGRKGEVR
ncbi:MAG: lysylphosphatidylglycerol synthase transmembrane domain-containing protein [Nanoarchaeota archaeon]